MIDWHERGDGKGGAWRFFELSSSARPYPRFVANLPWAEDGRAELVIGWTAESGLGRLAELTGALIQDLGRIYPSAAWMLTLTAYGSKRVVRELAGEPARLGLWKWLAVAAATGSAQDEASARDLVEEFDRLKESADPSLEHGDALAIRADARAIGDDVGPLGISVWGRPGLAPEVARTLPYGSLSVKGAPSAMERVEDRLAETIADTLVGGADLADIREALRASIDLASPPARAAA